MNDIFKRIITSLLIVTLSCGYITFNSSKIYAADTTASSQNGTNLVTVEMADSYRDYIQKNKNVTVTNTSIDISADTFTSSDYNPEIKMDFEGGKGKSIITNETGFVEWTVNVDVAGFYNMEVNYFPIVGRSSSIVRTVQIDGKMPFSECRDITFYRVWSTVVGENGKVSQKDSAGNDIQPLEKETPKWMTVPVCSSQGYVGEALKFYFSKGSHTIKFISVREPMLLSGIRLYNEQTPLDYKTIKKQYELNGYKEVNCDPIKFQAEAFEYKSEPMIAAYADRTSSAVEPNSPSNLLLNALGGSKWQQNGQWATWEFKVPKTGLYKIGIKSIQNINNGSYSSRKIYIDGKVPFSELNSVRFQYSSDWKMNVLGGEKDPYEFYLEAGEHQIKMEVTLGKMSDLLNEASSITDELNIIYRKILVVTGTIPDVNRDYQFDVIMPDVLSDLRNQSKRLLNVYNKVVNEAGMNGQNAQILFNSYMQTLDMAKHSDTIKNRFTEFQGNISALATWVMTNKNQPLAIDYFVVSSVSAKMPEPNAKIFQSVSFFIQSFLVSFYQDYNNVAGIEKDGSNPVKVWLGNGVTGGRDQAQVLKTYADNYLTPKSGIRVNLQLVSMGSLLPATFSGKGPDVAMTIGQSDAMNYAFRNAVVDLTRFSDFSEVSKRFSPSALTPLMYKNGVYGLPETQTFPMLFYRKDILQQLNLSIPETWQDVVAMLPVLQKNQMNFGLPPAVGPIGATMSIYAAFLYQNGGQLYTQDGTKSGIDSNKSIDAFSFLTRLYNDYQIPVVIDFVNRFRTGAVPIGIADYSTYNQITVFAPELNGLWDFTLVPGVKKENGTIDRTIAGAVNVCIILEQAKDKDDAWEFVKWWTSTDTQVQFGRELESIMGTAARYPTANLDAIYQIPWDTSSFNKLLSQWNSVKGIPEVPGGYYTPRYLDFAFRDVINNFNNSGSFATNSEDPGECLIDAAKNINNEINNKITEFEQTN